VTISTSKRYLFESQSEGVVGVGVGGVVGAGVVDVGVVGVGAGVVDVGGVGVVGVGVGGVGVESQKLGLGSLWSLQMVSLIHAHCDSGK